MFPKTPRMTIPRMNVSDKSQDMIALWRVPGVMVFFTLVGVAFAVAHDRFYHGLNGDIVQNYSHQQTVINAGTALAAIAKMFWALSIAIVFAQQMFSSLRQYPDTVNNIDRLFGMLENVLTLGNLKLWFRHPALLVLAVVLWLIPLSAVFTPGTINVQIVKYDQPNVPLTPIQPQQSWLGSQSFGSCQLDSTFSNGSSSVVLCRGPSADLNSAAISSATQRKVAYIPPPQNNQNSSYELTFTGPSISCSALTGTAIQQVDASYAKALSQRAVPGILGATPSPNELQLKFNGWANNSCFNLANPDWHNGTSASGNCALSGDLTTSFFYVSSNVSGVVTSTLHSCSLFDAAYTVFFRYVNNVLDVNVRNVTLMNRVLKDQVVNTAAPDFRNAVYVSVLDAFDGIMLGLGLNDTRAGSGTLMFSQGIAQTTMMRDFIYARRPLVAEDVATTLEQVFQNITISAMSEPKLQLPVDQRQEIIGQVWHTVNVYAYQPNAVYISYGVALLITILCNIWGIYVIVYKHGYHAYDLGFSTLLRTTRSPVFNQLVQAEARRGDGVVPQALDELRLRFNDGRQSGSHEDLGFVPASTDKFDATETGTATAVLLKGGSESPTEVVKAGSESPTEMEK